MNTRCRSSFAVALLAFACVTGVTSEAAAQTTRMLLGTPSGWGMYVHLSVGSEWLSLGDRAFTGSGLRRSDRMLASFNARGADIGMKLPLFAIFEAAVGVSYNWFTAGGFIDYGLGGGYGLSTPESPTLAAQVTPGDALLLLGGLELGGVLTLRPWVFHLMVQAGYRALTVPITAYETTTCTSSPSVRTGMGGGSQPCAPTADAGSWFVRPRLQIDLALGEPPRFTVGAYIVGEVAPVAGFGMGVVVGARLADLFPTLQ